MSTSNERLIRLHVEYDGTAYCGWQRQDNGISIQQKIEEAIACFGRPAKILGAGRTDAGVHARGQVAQFKTQASIPPDKWAPALNTKLPADIRIVSSREAPSGFHAQYDAKAKHYRYTFFHRPCASAILGRFSWHVFGHLDVDAMLRAAGDFCGEHDFSSFMAAGAQTRSPVRHITRSELHVEGDFLHYDVWGSGFLYNQVRIQAGTLHYVGIGKLAPDAIPAIIAGRDRTLAGPTAPPQGLCLMEVYY